MIQLHRLEGFYWVARHRGYARAARAFPYPISQPGVHQQVSKLEKDLGVRLFERAARDELRLTAAGERLLGFCAPFFEELPGVLEAIEADARGGVLRVDASGLVLRQLVPRWVRRLRAVRRDVRIDLEEIQVPDWSRLKSGAAHLIVDYFDDVPRGHGLRQVATSSTFLVLPADHPLAKRESIEPRALRGEAFVSYHPSLRQHALQMEAVRKRVGIPARTLSASSVESILALVQAGLGFSLIPWLDHDGPRVKGVVSRRQSGAGTQFPVHAAWLTRGPAHPLVDVALAAAPEPQHD